MTLGVANMHCKICCLKQTVKKTGYLSILSGITAYLLSYSLRERPCMLSWWCITSPFSSLIVSSSALKRLTGVSAALLCHPPCSRTKDKRLTQIKLFIRNRFGLHQFSILFSTRSSSCFVNVTDGILQSASCLADTTFLTKVFVLYKQVETKFQAQFCQIC